MNVKVLDSCCCVRYLEEMEDIMKVVQFEKMLGKTFVEVKADHWSVVFKEAGGGKYTLYHEQECCESVWIESIDGDLADLQGSPLLLAEEVSNVTEARLEGVDRGDVDKLKVENNHEEEWTFYKFATVKGHVTVRFVGLSNGYYSVSAQLCYTA